MDCEILLSVMNQKNKRSAIKQLGIPEYDKCLIVNQVVGDVRHESDDVSGNHRFISRKEKGLSRSRNYAVKNAVGKICIIADDDMKFVPDYAAIVKEAYRNHPEADVITFHFMYQDNEKNKKMMSEGKVGFLRSMKISSQQITFRKDSIKKAGVSFDENFGTGSEKYNWGEENIFLFDCLKSGLIIYHVPIITNTVYSLGSTWDKSSTPEHYIQQGAIYYRMSPTFWFALAMQFVIRKRKIYNKDMSGLAVLKSMMRGARLYKTEVKDV